MTAKSISIQDGPLPMIIDGRCRPPTKLIMERLLNPKTLGPYKARCCPLPFPPSALEGSMDLFWREFKEAGLTKALLAIRPLPPGEPNINEHVAETVAFASDKLIGAIMIDPTGRSHNPLTEIERWSKEYGFRAVCMDIAPVRPQIRYIDEMLHPVYKKCSELNLPLISAVGALLGDNLEHTHPRNVEPVLRRFPDLKLVMSHAPYPHVTEWIALAMRHPNLHIELDYQSWLPGVSLYLEAANSVLKEQVLFASAYPIIGMKEAVDFYKRFPFTPEAREHVMYKNWQRLLKL